MIVEKVQEECRVHASKYFCYFYCTSRDPSGQDLIVLLRLLLAQLCHPSAIPAPLKKLYDASNEVYPPKFPTIRELVSTLQSVLKAINETSEASLGRKPAITSDDVALVYLLVDGLDEIPWEHRQGFFDLLQACAEANSARVHLLVSSRYQVDIRSALRKPIFWTSISFEEQLITEDIE